MFTTTINSRIVYCNHKHYGSVSSGGAAPWSKGVPAVVGTVQLVPVGDAVGGKGGRYGGYGEGSRQSRLRRRGYCSNLIN